MTGTSKVSAPGTPEHLHMRAGDEGVGCEIHAWTVKDLLERLVPELRARHGKGGLNVCRDCLDRAKAAFDERKIHGR